MTRRRIGLLLAVVLTLGWFLLGCLSVPRVEARGILAGYELSGPVDSELARDYLQHSILPVDLEQARQRLLEQARPPSRVELADISQRYSPDVATLLFLEMVSALPENRALRERFEFEQAHVRRVGVDQAKPEPPDDLFVLLVPGWFYDTNGHQTNADYRIQRRLYERWGVPHRLVHVDENGAVQDNARFVADAIREEKAKRVVVVSASKSGAEVALALGRELQPTESQHVAAWLSIGGVVRGSPLADRVLQPDICWLVRLKLGLDGFDLRGLKSMHTRDQRQAFDTLQFPEHLRIISYVPVPLSGDITDRGSFGYQRMRPLGPNDGLTLLADELVPGGVTLLAPGVDHFLGPADAQNIWSTAIFRTVLAQLDVSSAGPR